MSTSFDFDSIQTTADLVKQNEDVKTPFASAIEALEDCGYDDSLLIVGYLLTNMIDFHHTQVFEQDHGKSITAYHAYTEGKLKSVKDTLLPMIKQVLESSEEQEDEEQTQE